MKAIASVDEHYAIGLNGQLIIKNKEDMKFFKEITMDNTVVMGRKTFESIGRPLPGRNNIVISTKDIIIPGVTVLNDWRDALQFEDAFVIGGAQIYGLFLDYYTEIYLTKNKGIYEADAYFPQFNKDKYNAEILVKSDTYSIVKYSKK